MISPGRGKPQLQFCNADLYWRSWTSFALEMWKLISGSLSQGITICFFRRDEKFYYSYREGQLTKEISTTSNPKWILYVLCCLNSENCSLSRATYMHVLCFAYSKYTGFLYFHIDVVGFLFVGKIFISPIFHMCDLMIILRITYEIGAIVILNFYSCEI